MATLTLFEKLDQIESRYQDLTAQISSPEVLGDSARYQKLARTHAELSAMVEKYRGGVVPDGPRNLLDDVDIAGLAEYHAAMDGSRGYLLHEGLRWVMQTVAGGNEYIQSVQPWAIAKDPAGAGRLDEVLAALMRKLARQAICLAPFMPTMSQQLWEQLGGPATVSAQRFANVEALSVTGWRVRKGAGLFPRPQATV